MSNDSPRLAELRRRVHADPASIAFAQLAEEYRRSGNYDEAIKYCRSGLARHPGYLSARVTLGRALIEIGQLDEAAGEFEVVLKSAPDNLAAIRGMAEIHQRRGDMAAALEAYRRALELARFDPELEEAVNRIAREMGSISSPAGAEAPTFEAPSEFRSVAEGSAPGAQNVLPSPSSSHLIDFDAILASLGVPDASPPPVMEMLLAQTTSAPPAPASSGTPGPPAAQMEQSFADLERELRALDEAAAPPAPPAPPARPPAAAAVLEELESWLRVLQIEQTRAAQS